ncbi:MAG: DUF1553 domain-containing protein [Planctomycetaceae bacterium]
MDVRRKNRLKTRLLLLGLICLSGFDPCHAKNDFQKTIAPLLESHCLDCHNSVDQKGGFSLQTASELRESGFVVPRRSTDSDLLAVVTGHDGEPASMPKNGKPLTVDQIQSLRDWIDAGAVWPDGVRLQQAAVSDFEWWSLKPVQKPIVPEFGNPSARTAIDAFILQKLREKNLSPSPEADRRTLIRRLTFDLTGLPPTPDEVAAFKADTRLDAYEQLVDRLLASDHYGERWARHWLDVVRYADTHGYDKDKLRPNAWPYRDYVVRSFNEDKPYSRFVEEQIAGDVLFPNEPDGIVGLGFLAAGPWDFIGHVEVPESKIDGKEARNLDRDEMASATLNTFCSATVQCARCHNHKFDPITQQQYYGLQSVFAAVDRADRVYDSSKSAQLKRESLATRLEHLRKETASLKAALQAAGGTDLAGVEARIAKLKSMVKVQEKKPEFGYHSSISESRKESKWVRVVFPEPTKVTAIVLHACHDDFGGIGAGFGFPRKFSISAKLADSKTQRILVDRSQPQTNPGLSPVRIDFDEPVVATSIQLTATELAERSNDYIFALAELRVLDQSGTNIAEGARVESLDSIEAPVRWRRLNLVDGIWPTPSNPRAARDLMLARQRRDEILDRVNTPARTSRLEEVTSAIRETEAAKKALPAGKMVYAVATKFVPQGNFRPTNGEPRKVRFLHRGNVSQPRDEVQPGRIPLTQTDTWQFNLPDNHTEADRRAALARWISSEENPLTWRSIVNRIWQYHFGSGLVETPNDFGRMGQRPTHPELLDWLATEFRDNGQSFKALHRLIVTSSVYRQSSAGNLRNQRIDSDNQFLWRMNRRRLTAEEVRDAVLEVSGRMNLKMGGPGFYLFELEKTAHSPHYQYHKFDPTHVTTHRRSLYRFVVRSQPDPFMTTLDCADSSQSTPRRNETLTSLQALSLLNNRFMLTMSQYFAERLQEAASTTDEQVRMALQLVSNRDATPTEVQRLRVYVEKHGLPNLCRLLFNLSEFSYVD